ncbi:hypothetical protein [Isoptericola cucumis]|uniref:Secreted protein n=1 Tax=Isoptericola cucumis TaxID=1776856 RepID=A0ABQ2B515_9MICO|nr:hypothetical protein [Isoptericola cucumis]GGI08035.1 hypothetical protein GCM10007368_19160 [Isoptericola cucumis]
MSAARLHTVRAPLAVLVAVLGLLVPIALVAGAGPADAAVQKLTPGNFRWSLSRTPASLVSDLDSALPNVSMQTVVDDGNRAGTACAPSVEHRVASFCWNAGDRDTSAWYPQGVTTSNDALGAGTYEGRRVLMASWYDHADDGVAKGSRVSVVDLTSSTTAPKYRHVLLAEPVSSGGQASFKPVNVHAGGLAWYGNLLYVVDTTGGLRVFDLDHLWKVSTGSSTKVGRQPDGSYHAFDYKYVLPQVAKYSDSTAGGYPELQHSSVSLDRTSSPDSLVVSEYRSKKDIAAGHITRTVRVGIDYTDRLLVESSDGLARATEAYRTDLESVQGSTAIDGEFFFSQSDGDDFADPNSRGDLHTWKPGAAETTRHGNAFPAGPEDLSYDPTRDALWSLSEYPGRRYVYAMDASSF